MKEEYCTIQCKTNTHNINMCEFSNLTFNLTNGTNCSIGEGSFNEDPTLPFIVKFQVALYTYVLPTIVSVGSLGNLMAIYLIMADKQMRNVSSSVYLSSLLVSDTGMLVNLFLVWMEVLGYRLNHVPAVCKISPYWAYVFGYLSIWFVVCITIETFITICHPTRIKQMCTVFRARVVAISLFVTALLLYIVTPMITEIRSKYYPSVRRKIDTCQTIPKYEKLASIVSYSDSVLTLIVPFIVIIVLLTLIILAIMQSIQRKKKRSLRKANGQGQSSSSSLPQVRVAKMLFILSVSVVFLNVPSHVFRLRSIFMGVTTLSEVEGLIHLIFLFVSYTSFSVKFFICVACSENFRKLFVIHCCPTVSRYQVVNQHTQDTAV